MATSIVIRGALPSLSPSLDALVSEPARSAYGSEGDPESRFVINRARRAPTPEEVYEAQRALDGYVALQVPSARMISQWLEALNGTVGNAQTAASFATKAGALNAMLSDYPAACFTADTLKQAQRRFKFFPSGADLAEFLDPILAMIRRKEGEIRRVANYKPPEPELVRRPTEEEKAEVTAKLEAWRAETQATTQALSPDKRPAPNAHYLRDEQLLARYEQEAASAAHTQARDALLFRAASLRRKLGKEEFKI